MLRFIWFIWFIWFVIFYDVELLDSVRYHRFVETEYSRWPQVAPEESHQLPRPWTLGCLTMSHPYGILPEAAAPRCHEAASLHPDTISGYLRVRMGTVYHMVLSWYIWLFHGIWLYLQIYPGCRGIAMVFDGSLWIVEFENCKGIILLFVALPDFHRLSMTFHLSNPAFPPLKILLTDYICSTSSSFQSTVLSETSSRPTWPACYAVAASAGENQGRRGPTSVVHCETTRLASKTQETNHKSKHLNNLEDVNICWLCQLRDVQSRNLCLVDGDREDWQPLVGWLIGNRNLQLYHTVFHGPQL